MNEQQLKRLSELEAFLDMFLSDWRKLTDENDAKAGLHAIYDRAEQLRG